MRGKRRGSNGNGNASQQKGTILNGRYPDKALSYGLDNLAKCLEGLPGNVIKVQYEDK